MMDLVYLILGIAFLVGLILIVGYVAAARFFLVKAKQGKALIITSRSGSKVVFSASFYYPVFNRLEEIDVSVKRIEIWRTGKDGLVCKDNMRADIKVAFFVRVNKTEQDVLKVAQSIGCERASDPAALVEFFDAKFSEALKTVGKGFDFTELYSSREKFKNEILQIIGTDLNGYILDDAAIDYLEQTPKETLNPDNILDAEGIKKITDLTSKQQMLANKIERDKEKTIKQQDVEAREAILELDRQRTEAEQRQKKEIAALTSREEAEAAIVKAQEWQKSEQARIATAEELEVAEQNRERQVIVARRAKERTDAVEGERVEQARQLEQNERERIVTLAQIEKEKSVEEQRKNIQDVIRERVVVERQVVEEQERIKDTQAHAGAEREKHVALVEAQRKAEEEMIKRVRAAEAERQAADHRAKQVQVEAEADKLAADQRAEAMKTLAAAKAEEEAVHGMSEVRVMEARASALAKEGAAQAEVIQKKAEAEAMGLAAKAEATQKQGEAEAEVMRQKMNAEAEGITQKAEAMKKLDAVGREHEEFKLRLAKDKEIELAQITIQRDIAEAQASVIREGLKSAKIDIVGGDSMFFDRIVNSISYGKSVDRFVQNSDVASGLRDAFIPNGNGTSDAGEALRVKVKELVDTFGVTTADLKNLTTSALLLRLIGMTKEKETKAMLQGLLDGAKQAGLSDKPAAQLLGEPGLVKKG
ncbi:MAG: flotillin family protein [Sumerlaeia bacterium]